MTRTRGQEKKRAEEGIPPTPPQNLETTARPKRTTRQSSRSISAEPKPKAPSTRGRKKAKPQTTTISEDESEQPAPQKSQSPEPDTESEPPAIVTADSVTMASNNVEGTSEPLSSPPFFLFGYPGTGTTRPKPTGTGTNTATASSLENPWDWPDSRDPFLAPSETPAPRGVSKTARLLMGITDGTIPESIRRFKAHKAAAAATPAVTPGVDPAPLGSSNVAEEVPLAIDSQTIVAPLAPPTHPTEVAPALRPAEISQSDLVERMFQRPFETFAAPGGSVSSSIGTQGATGLWMTVPTEAVADIAAYVASHPAICNTRTALEIQNQLTNVVIADAVPPPELPATPTSPTMILHTSTASAQENAPEAPVTPQSRGWGLSSFIPKTVQKFLPSFRTPVAQLPSIPHPQTEPAPNKGLKRTRDTAPRTSAKRHKASTLEDQEMDIEAGPVETSRQSLALVKPRTASFEFAGPSRDAPVRNVNELEVPNSEGVKNVFGPIRQRTKHSSRREEYSTSKRVLRERFTTPKPGDFKDEKDFEIAKLKHLVDGWENLFDGDLGSEGVANEKQERVRKMAADPANPFGMRSVIETMRQKKQMKEAEERAEREEAEKDKLREQWNTWKRREKYLHLPAPPNPPEWIVEEWAQEAAREKAKANAEGTSAHLEDVDMDQQTPRPKTPRTSKRKSPKPPSPDIIPNRPGCSYGMNEDYFIISDSDEDEDTEMMDTSTPMNRRSSSNVFEQQRSIEKGKSPASDAAFDEDSTMSLGGHGPTLTFRPPSPGSSEDGDTEDEPSPSPGKNWSEQTPPPQPVEEPQSWHPSREFTRNELSVMKQREQVMKHAPKNPSRLFQSSRYSDSTVVSDDGNVPTTPTPRNIFSQPAPVTPGSSYQAPAVESANSSPEPTTPTTSNGFQPILQDADVTPRASAVNASASTLGGTSTFSSFNTNNTGPTPATTFTVSPPLNASPFARPSSADAYLANVPAHVRDFVNSKWEAGGSALTANAAEVIGDEFKEFSSLEMAGSAAQSYQIGQQAQQFIDQNWTSQHEKAAGADFLAEYQAWIDQGEPGLEAWRSPSAAIAASL